MLLVNQFAWTMMMNKSAKEEYAKPDNFLFIGRY